MKYLGKIFNWTKKYIWVFVLIIVLNTVLQWLYSYLPLFISYVFKVLGKDGGDVALPSFLMDWFNSYSDVLIIILMVSISMLALQLVRSIMRFFCNYYQGALAQYIGYDLRLSVYNKITSLSFSYHNKADIGDLIQRSTTDVNRISDFMSHTVPQFINIFVTITFGAYQVGRINITMMLVSLITLPITAISSIIFFRAFNKGYTKVENYESKMTTIIQENINGARIVKAFANEKYEFEKMDKAAMDFFNSHKKPHILVASYWGFSDFITFLQYAITIITGIVLTREGIVSSGDLVACLLLMSMLVWPMKGLGRTISNFGRAAVSAKRIDDVLVIESEYEVNGEKEPNIKGNIEFNNVSFKFDDDNKSLLNDISFKIKAGTTVALVGKTGSGKSTICNLLTRMIEYQDGSILIDGVELKDIEKHHLRKNIRLVLQDPYLYTKTIYENVAIAGVEKEDEIYRAAEIAMIHNDILGFEKGYNTLVGEKGTTLSGGQKQRVAIARMLVTDAPVIIFDDSLSALDTKTDIMIRQALKNQENKKTMIIITHRITTAKEADLILVLDEGRIVDSGHHEDLVSKDGLYKELWGIQGDLEAEFIDVLKGGK